MHEHDVGGLDGGVAARAAHGDADIRAHEDGRVVDAVADEAEHLFFVLGGEHALHLFHLILRKQRSLIAREPDLLCHALRDGLVVAGQHHRLTAHAVQLRYDLRRLRLHLVGDEERARKAPVFRHIHHGADAFFLPIRDAVPFHQLAVAAEDDAALLFGDDATARDIGEGIAALGLFAVPRGDGPGDGVRGIMLGDGGEAQHLFGLLCGRNFRHGEVSLGERARLVEHEDVGGVELFQIIGTLDEDAVARRRADARKEGEGDGDDQRAGAGHDEEGKRPVHPCGPVHGDKPRHEGQEQRHRADDGRIVFGKFGDEVFRLRLLVGGVFHQFQNFRDGRIVKFLFHPHRQLRGEVDAAADDLAPFQRLARERFARQRLGIEGGSAREDDAVQRHLFAGVDEDGIPHLDLGRVYPFEGAVRLHEVGIVGADIHEGGDGLP